MPAVVVVFQTALKNVCIESNFSQWNIIIIYLAGNGFVASYSRDAAGCTTSGDCNGFSCVDGLCQCPSNVWGSVCDTSEICQGTKRVRFDLNGEVQRLAIPSAKQASTTASPLSLLFEDNLPHSDPLDPIVAYANDLDCTFYMTTDAPFTDAVVFEVSVVYDLEPTFDLLWLDSYAVLTGSNEDKRRAETYAVPADASGTASLRLTTDGRGRRLGFRADVRAISANGYAGEEWPCKKPGQSGFRCEVSHCVSQNQLQARKSHIASRLSLGRAVSQTAEEPVPAMPWAPRGGCQWPLSIFPLGPDADEVISVRLVSNAVITLDLESHPPSDVGDKLVVSVGGQDTVFFVERCKTNETCSASWQTGACLNGGCIVAKSLEVLLNIAPYDRAMNNIPTSLSLVTDRNDKGEIHKGFDFDVMLVVKCPSAESSHCESEGGICIDSFCYCDHGGIPCDCPCDGDPPMVGSANIGLILGLLLPLFAILVVVFLWYRRRQLQKYRGKKAELASKEAELQAFRDSIVGMCAVKKHYVPIFAPLTGTATLGPTQTEQPPKVTWCWKETDVYMTRHSNDIIFGIPSDCWVIYDAPSTAILESAHKCDHNTCSPIPGYTVDLKSMTQTNDSTRFQRQVLRHVEVDDTADSHSVDIDDLDLEVGSHRIPSEIRAEPQMVLIPEDLVQIANQRDDGWAFGTKLHPADPGLATSLLQKTYPSSSDDDMEVITTSGWFPLNVTRVPTGEDLEVLKSSVGDAGALQPPAYWDAITDPTVVQRHVLDLKSDEAQNVIREFMSTLVPPRFNKVNVVRVERIQNLSQWQYVL